MMACPYKARSFIHETLQDQLPHAPRGKGTVESCTFCVHRVDRSDNPTPACVEACTAEGHDAMLFGDLNDPNSSISRRLEQYGGRQVRADFLGNDQPTPVTEVGTFRCRALHSNHLAGHLYMEYASDTLRKQAPVADIPERGELKDGGRGYMRNISLVNVWATAPFMHNNAIGPEICGKPANKANDFHRARYVGPDGKLLDPQPDCLRYDPSVEGRFDLYKRSMHELLHPNERGTKRTLTNADLLIDVGLRQLAGKTEKPLLGFGRVRIPAGTSAGFLNGLQHKQLVGDLFLAKRDPAKLEAAGRKALIAPLQAMADDLLKQPARFVDILREKRDFISANYQTCTEEIENGGHRFGEDLAEADKKALTAFLATL